jgi:hypothetical protein
MIAPAEIWEIVARLPREEVVTMTFRVGALQDAREIACGGPEIMSMRQAAEVFGWDPKRWRRWAEDERIPGAWQEENGHWRLPREGCRARVAEEMKQGRRGPRRGTTENTPLKPVGPGGTTRMSLEKKTRRGPRRTA